MMNYSSRLWTILIVASIVGVGLVTYADFGNSPLRAIIAAWFLMVCPGMAFIRLLRLNESITIWTLAIALSLALDALVAGIMLFAGRWSPQFGISALMGISLLGLALKKLQPGV